MLFRSFTVHRGSFGTSYPKEVLSAEPMFYRASAEYAREHGGPITRAFLNGMPDDWKNIPVTIDSRVHMLMPGWFPCIPGMHHDFIPRTRIDGQPNYLEPDNGTEHLMGLINGEIAPTEFALGEIDLAIPPVGELIYREWHPRVMEAIQDGTLRSELAPSNRYIQFDNHAFHQGTKAVGSGWRWFIRVSRNTERANDCKNEIRRQVQVYMENPMEGW
jgi:hypothetical protein